MASLSSLSGTGLLRSGSRRNPETQIRYKHKLKNTSTVSYRHKQKRDGEREREMRKREREESTPLTIHTLLLTFT